jgi:hypothetical protein
MKDATANGPLVRNLRQPSFRFASNEGDVKFLQFMYDRLKGHHMEDPNTDYMLTLNKIILEWDLHRQDVYDAGYKHAERIAEDNARAQEAVISDLHSQINALQQHNNELEEILATKDIVIRGFSEVTEAIALYVGTKSNAARF